MVQILVPLDLLMMSQVLVCKLREHKHVLLKIEWPHGTITCITEHNVITVCTVTMWWHTGHRIFWESNLDVHIYELSLYRRMCNLNTLWKKSSWLVEKEALFHTQWLIAACGCLLMLLNHAVTCSICLEVCPSHLIRLKVTSSLKEAQICDPFREFPGVNCAWKAHSFPLF